MARRSGKSYTLQPDERMRVFHNLQALRNAPANYENVQSMEDKELGLINHGYHRREISMTRQPTIHFHCRSQSQHHYNAMLHPPPDYNNYYNLPQGDPCLDHSPPPPIIMPSRQHQHNQRHHHHHHHHQQQQQQRRTQLDSITVMRLSAELGVNIDEAPRMPPSRKYSISTRGRDWYRVPFPQTRVMTVDVNDPEENIHIRKGESVIVLGPSKGDRSKFTICYNGGHIELPHLFTQQSHIQIDRSRWHGH